MGCGTSSAKVGVEPDQTGSKSITQSGDKSSKDATGVRTSSGKSRDSGFGDNNNDFGRKADSPQSRSVGFKAPAPLNGRVTADEDEAEVLRKLRSEGLIQRSLTKTNFGVSFEVVDDERVIRSRPPPRLARLERSSAQRKTLTDDQINAKLEKAKKRKRIQEAKRIARIRSVTRQESRFIPDLESTTNSDLYSTERQNPNTESVDLSYTKHLGYDNQALSHEQGDNYLYSKRDARPLPALEADLINSNSHGSRHIPSPPISNKQYTNNLNTGGGDLYPMDDRRSSIGSNLSREVKSADRGMGKTENRSSHMDRVNDPKGQTITFNEYSREAALDVSSMLAAAQERVDNYTRDGGQNSESPLRGRLSRENSNSPPAVSGGSKWLKKDADRRKLDDDLTRADALYNSDNDGNKNRERSISRLSIPSSGSADSVDFWNE